MCWDTFQGQNFNTPQITSSYETGIFLSNEIKAR